MGEITQILDDLEQTESGDTRRLLSLLYNELRRLAHQMLNREKPGQTLQPTALVHEAFLRLAGGEQLSNWKHRGHFYLAAAEAMRRILVDQARRKASIKSGRDWQRVEFQQAEIVDFGNSPERSLEIIDLDSALKVLEQEDLVASQIVQLRYFAGQTIEETAVLLNISAATCRSRWSYARAWLYGRLTRRSDFFQ